jgi:hypothetical protein
MAQRLTAGWHRHAIVRGPRAGADRGDRARAPAGPSAAATAITTLNAAAAFVLGGGRTPIRLGLGNSTFRPPEISTRRCPATGWGYTLSTTGAATELAGRRTRCTTKAWSRASSHNPAVCESRSRWPRNTGKQLTLPSTSRSPAAGNSRIERRLDPAFYGEKQPLDARIYHALLLRDETQWRYPTRSSIRLQPPRRTSFVTVWPISNRCVSRSALDGLRGREIAGHDRRTAELSTGDGRRWHRVGSGPATAQLATGAVGRAPRATG